MYLLLLIPFFPDIEEEEEEDAETTKTCSSLFKLSDATGNMKFEKIAEKSFKTTMLDSNVSQTQTECQTDRHKDRQTDTLIDSTVQICSSC